MRILKKIDFEENIILNIYIVKKAIIIVIIMGLILIAGKLFFNNKKGKEVVAARQVKNSSHFTANNKNESASQINATGDDTLTYDLPKEFGEKYPVVLNSLRYTVEKSNAFVKGLVSIHLIQKRGAFSGQPASYFEATASQGRFEILSATLEGLCNGITRLEYELNKYDGALPNEKITDWSVIDTRAVHLIVRGNSDFDKMKKLVDLARENYYNTLIIMVTPGVGLKTLRTTEGKPKWTTGKFRSLIMYAKHSGLKVIPEIKLLTHQDKLLNKQYPQYLLNNTTYNPDAKGLYTNVIFPIINEVIALTNCSVLSVGHDEVAGYTGYNNEVKTLGKGNPILPPSLYLKDVIKLDSFLTTKKIKMMMWGDMLLKPDHFPKMNKSFLHGNSEYAQLINKIPRNIIICDWHYVLWNNQRYNKQQTELPSYVYLSNKGFEVWGATWKWLGATQNFTNYVANSNAETKGMIATTWYGIDKFDVMKEIIIKSGQIFWNAK